MLYRSSTEHELYKGSQPCLLYKGSKPIIGPATVTSSYTYTSDIFEYVDLSFRIITDSFSGSTATTYTHVTTSSWTNVVNSAYTSVLLMEGEHTIASLVFLNGVSSVSRTSSNRYDGFFNTLFSYSGSRWNISSFTGARGTTSSSVISEIKTNSWSSWIQYSTSVFGQRSVSTHNNALIFEEDWDSSSQPNLANVIISHYYVGTHIGANSGAVVGSSSMSINIDGSQDFIRPDIQTLWSRSIGSFAVRRNLLHWTQFTSQCIYTVTSNNSYRQTSRSITEAFSFTNYPGILASVTSYSNSHLIHLENSIPVYGPGNEYYPLSNTDPIPVPNYVQAEKIWLDTSYSYNTTITQTYTTTAITHIEYHHSSYEATYTPQYKASTSSWITSTSYIYTSNPAQGVTITVFTNTVNNPVVTVTLSKYVTDELSSTLLDTIQYSWRMYELPETSQTTNSRSHPAAFTISSRISYNSTTGNRDYKLVGFAPYIAHQHYFMYMGQSYSDSTLNTDTAGLNAFGFYNVASPYTFTNTTTNLYDIGKYRFSSGFANYPVLESGIYGSLHTAYSSYHKSSYVGQSAAASVTVPKIYFSMSAADAQALLSNTEFFSGSQSATWLYQNVRAVSTVADFGYNHYNSTGTFARLGFNTEPVTSIRESITRVTRTYTQNRG